MNGPFPRSVVAAKKDAARLNAAKTFNAAQEAALLCAGTRPARGAPGKDAEQTVPTGKSPQRAPQPPGHSDSSRKRKAVVPGGPKPKGGRTAA